MSFKRTHNLLIYNISRHIIIDCISFKITSENYWLQKKTRLLGTYIQIIL